MKRPLAVWIAGPLLVVLLGFIAVLATSDTGGSGPGPSPLLGRQAPEVSGVDLDGSPTVVAAGDGAFLIVNFFAPWCVPCVREHPELVEFAQRHDPADDARVVSVVYDATESSVRDFFAEHGGDWPVITDPDGRIALAFGVSGVPETYLIAPDGTVASKFTGGVTAAGLDAALDAVRGAR